MPARAFLIRHGQTDWNHTHRIQGHADQPLNPIGFLQARRVADYFSGRPICALYSSHLQRSIQTATAIARQTGAMPIIDPALAEIRLGAWEGLTGEEVDARYDGAYERWQSAPSQVSIPGAERLTQFRARIRKTFARIAAQHPEGDVVIVSHGGVIAALLADWLQADYDSLLRRLSLDNAGISALEHHARPPQVLWINATEHLAMLDGDVPSPIPVDSTR